MQSSLSGFFEYPSQPNLHVIPILHHHELPTLALALHRAEQLLYHLHMARLGGVMK